MLSVLTYFLTSLALSADAFAAALARGAKEQKPGPGRIIGTGLTFGVTEGLMCLLGWGLAGLVAGYIEALDHWIALILLVIIGGLMVRNGLSDDDDEDDDISGAGGWGGNILTAVGTSIDSATVGVALALSGGPVWVCAAVGATSAIMAMIGFAIGPSVRGRLGARAESLGGLVLISIGVYIFVSHMWLT